MAEHEPCIGASDDWYTPRAIFDALNLTFDLDPCSPGEGHWVPALQVFTKVDDGLSRPWHGCVFVNPPFGGREGHVPWLERFLDHGNGIAIVRAYTSSGWFHRLMPRAEMIVFPKGKTKFIRPDGSVGESPGHGVVIIGMGRVACAALSAGGIGMVWDRRPNPPQQSLRPTSSTGQIDPASLQAPVRLEGMRKRAIGRLMFAWSKRSRSQI